MQSAVQLLAALRSALEQELPRTIPYPADASPNLDEKLLTVLHLVSWGKQRPSIHSRLTQE